MNKKNLNKLRSKDYYKKFNLKPKKMTYVIGARCKDGVVLIGDRKVTFAGDLGISKYEEKIKITPQLKDIVFTAAGVKDLFEEFLEEIERKVFLTNNAIIEQNKKNPESLHLVYTVNDFKHNCVELLKELKEMYSEIQEEGYPSLQVLFAVRHPDKHKSVLYYIDSTNCFPSEVNGIIPIGESQVAEVFRKSWKPEMTMEETAKLGAFIIKYIEKEKISDLIGVGKYEPQILFIKDEEMPREIKDVELKNLLKDIDKNVEEIRKKIGSLSRFLRD